MRRTPKYGEGLRGGRRRGEEEKSEENLVSCDPLCFRTPTLLGRTASTRVDVPQAKQNRGGGAVG